MHISTMVEISCIFFEQLLNNYCACLITTKYVKLKNSNQDLIFNALFAVNAHKTCAKSELYF